MFLLRFRVYKSSCILVVLAMFQYLYPQWVFVLRYALLFFFFRDCFLQDVCVLGFYGQLGVQVYVVFVYMFFGCSRHINCALHLFELHVIRYTMFFNLMSNCRIFLSVEGR